MNINDPESVTLTAAELARLLRTVGGQRVTAKMIRADLAAGAPVNPDGKINLLHYAAWLAKESRRQ